MGLPKPSLSQLRKLSTSRMSRGVSWPKPDYGPMEVMRTELMNGIRVAAAKPLGAQIAACTVMFQAGSRFEIDNQLGAAHFLRAASSATSCGYSAYHKTRWLQQLGASITCTSDRQTTAYTLRCPLPCFPKLKSYLLDASARCCFKQWELDDRMPIVREDLTRIDPEARVLDLLQQASWSGPLANSIYCNEDRIDDMSAAVLNGYIVSNYKSDACTVASVGLPFDETMVLAENVEFRRERPSPRCASVSCARGGFEYYDLGQGSDTWIAIGVPGCGTFDLTCLLKHAIVAYSCGTGDMQAGQHYHDRTPMSPLGTMAGNDVYTSYRAFNISYMETGVFGILAKTKASNAWNAATAAVQFLKSIGELNFTQVENGKNRLKTALAIHDEDPVRVSEGLALQLASNVQLDSAKSSISCIDQICPHEISGTAKILAGKCGIMSVAVVGDVGAVPHDRELVCGC